MSEISELFHDIVNRLNSVNVIAGSLKYEAVSSGSQSDMNNALKNIENNICEAAELLEELKSKLCRKGCY